jgi:hypothetical protein
MVAGPIRTDRYNADAMLRSHSHSFLSLTLVATLLLRSLIAPGYMPDGEGSGAFRICHSGLDDAATEMLFGVHAGHGHGSGEAEDGLTNDQLCPLGDGLSPASLPVAPGVEVLAPPATAPPVPATILATQSSSVGFEARAPPVATG